MSDNKEAIKAKLEQALKNTKDEKLKKEIQVKLKNLDKTITK